MSVYSVDTGNRFPIKAWTKGVSVEDVAVEQLRNIANMPFIHKHIAWRSTSFGTTSSVSTRRWMSRPLWPLASQAGFGK